LETMKERNGITFLTSLIEGFEVLTAMLLQSYIFWDITPYKSLAFRSNMSSSAGLKSKPSREPALLRLTFNELHCAVSQKIELFDRVWGTHETC
jgi:hypothetical protein